MESGIILILIAIGIVYYINKRSIKSVFSRVKSKEDYKKSSQNTYKKYEEKFDYGKYKNNYEKYSSNTNNYGSGYYGSSQSSGYEDYVDKVIDLISDIKKDFNKAPFRDKFILNDSSIFIGYNFEQGRIIKIKYDLVVIDFNGMSKTSYKLPTSVANTLLQFFTQLSSQARSRTGRRPFATTSTDNVKYTEEQLKNQETFWKLKKINDLRMEQLNKMATTNPDRPALVNELNVVKAKMKAAYLKSGLKKETTKK